MLASLIFIEIFIEQGVKEEAQKMEEILYETGFSKCKTSNYIISNYNNTNKWETLKSHLLGIASATLQQLFRMQVWRFKYVENSLSFKRL